MFNNDIIDPAEPVVATGFFAKALNCIKNINIAESVNYVNDRIHDVFMMPKPHEMYVATPPNGRVVDNDTMTVYVPDFGPRHLVHDKWVGMLYQNVGTVVGAGVGYGLSRLLPKFIGYKTIGALSLIGAGVDIYNRFRWCAGVARQYEVIDEQQLDTMNPIILHDKVEATEIPSVIATYSCRIFDAYLLKGQLFQSRTAVPMVTRALVHKNLCSTLVSIYWNRWRESFNTLEPDMFERCVRLSGSFKISASVLPSLIKQTVLIAYVKMVHLHLIGQEEYGIAVVDEQWKNNALLNEKADPWRNNLELRRSLRHCEEIQSDFLIGRL